jgi:hypothetical protein
MPGAALFPRVEYAPAEASHQTPVAKAEAAPAAGGEVTIEVK